MGYTAELWAAPPGHLLHAVAAAHPEPPSTPMPDETRQAWAGLAATVAQAMAQGGGRLVAEYSNYLAALVRAVGFHYGSVDHTSSGGDEFRHRFLAGPAADRYGRDAVAHLFARDVGGLVCEEYPRLGHLTADEVAATVARLRNPPPPGDHPDDVNALLVFDRALARAARHGLELHAVYG